ncbi:MAG: chloride channel protein [Gemmatimonadetes bacterium]|nr:chloride channel protein [Gemmatimonadota bacterium]
MSSFARRRLLRGAARTRRATLGSVRTVAGRWEAFVRWFNGLEVGENAVLLGFALAIGVIGALGVVAFYRLIDLAYISFFEWPATHLSRQDFLAYRPLLTGAGIAVAWWTMERFGSGLQGLNVPDVQLAVARRGGDIPTRPAFARTAASAITLGAGGSAGSEGPVAVLGSALASLLGRVFRFDAERVKILVAAGAAAGISAAFNAPLAGAFFALEEILGSLSVGAFPPVVVSSVVAAVVSHSFFGNHPAFPIPVEYGYALTREVFVFYPVLGLLAGLVAALFIRVYFLMETGARRVPLPAAAVPWVGGAVVGAMVYASNGVLVGYGHLAVSLEVFGRLPWSALLLLALGKIVATSVTLNAGGSGGVFTPSLYVGAALGGAFGVALADVFPGLGLHPEAYAVVGMGALVAAATDAPITGILIVFEMTNDYAIVLPLMLATVIAYVVARRLEPDSLYSGWLRRRGERIAHGADRDVLAGLRVADACDRDPQVIGEAATVAQLLEHLGGGEQTEFPVVDTQLRLTGVITVAQLGRIAKDRGDLAPVLVAADLAIPVEPARPDESLLEAIRKMGIRGSDTLPVVDPRTGRLCGLISRAHILAVYERVVAAGPEASAGGSSARSPSVE